MLTIERLEELAQDVALRYHPPSELAIKYGLDDASLQSLLAMPEFKRLVLRFNRKIDEEGSKLRIAARRAVAELVPVLFGIARSPEFPTADRVAAFKQLVSVAGLDNQPVPMGAAFAVNIQLQPLPPAEQPVRVISANEQRPELPAAADS